MIRHRLRRLERQLLRPGIPPVMMLTLTGGALADGQSQPLTKAQLAACRAAHNRGFRFLMWSDEEDQVMQPSAPL